MSICATNMTRYGFEFSEQDKEEFKKFWNKDIIPSHWEHLMYKLVSRCSCGELHVVNGEYYDHDAYFCKQYFCDKCGQELNSYNCGVSKEEIEYLKNKYNIGG